jgi:hypothetical protein
MAWKITPVDAGIRKKYSRLCPGFSIHKARIGTLPEDPSRNGSVFILHSSGLCIAYQKFLRGLM